MFLTLLATLSPTFLAPAPPQDPGAQEPNAPDLVHVAELKVKRYQPQHVDAYDLVRLTEQMIGRKLYLHERGGYSSEPVGNLQLIGDTLVLYDTEDYLVRMVQMIEELDRAEQRGESHPTQSKLYETWEFTPRYLSLDAVVGAVQPLQRHLTEGTNTTSNISFSELRRMVVVRDTVERVSEIRALFERIDVPQDQVTITCWLLQGTGSLEDSEVPGGAGLVDHLTRLLPGQGFRTIGFGLLQSSVSTQRSVSIQLADSSEGQPPYFLELRPEAYDRQTGSLSVSSCSLSYAPGASPNLFSTDAVLRGGEYTVIGASGASPILVAILVTPVGP